MSRYVLARRGARAADGVVEWSGWAQRASRPHAPMRAATPVSSEHSVKMDGHHCVHRTLSTPAAPPRSHSPCHPLDQPAIASYLRCGVLVVYND